MVEYGMMKHVAYLLRCVQWGFPTKYIFRYIERKRFRIGPEQCEIHMKIAVEWYVFVRMLFCFGALAFMTGSDDRTTRNIITGFVAYFAADSIIYLFGAVLFSSSMTDTYFVPGRTMILNLLAYFQLICTFAFVYKAFDLICNMDTWRDALYFSIVTTATVGYGDMVPKVNSAGRAVVALQIVVMVGFALLFLGNFASRLGRKNEP